MTRIERVVAVDPGKMTGFAVLERRGDQVEILASAELKEDAVVPAVKAVLMRWDDQEDTQIPVRLVIERFTVTIETAKKADAAHYSIEMIGALKQLCRDLNYPLEAIVFQSPAQAKEAFPNPTLKRLGLWHRGGAGHALDAIRHAAVYLVRSGWNNFGDSEKKFVV